MHDFLFFFGFVTGTWISKHGTLQVVGEKF